MHKELVQKVRQANVSVAAREVMQDLLYESSAKRPLVVADIEALSLSVRRSVPTVRKALRELVKEGFLTWDGTIVSLKHRVYKVMFELVGVVKRAVKKVVQSVKKVAQKIMGTKVDDQAAQEVLNTLKDLGFEDFERKEVLDYNGAEKTQRLILEYLETLKRGETTPVKEWFIARYVEEQQEKRRLEREGRNPPSPLS